MKQEWKGFDTINGWCVIAPTPIANISREWSALRTRVEHKSSVDKNVVVMQQPHLSAWHKTYSHRGESGLDETQGVESRKISWLLECIQQQYTMTCHLRLLI
jgi:hypothetical protein